jgi:hypothetical protein
MVERKDRRHADVRKECVDGGEAGLLRGRSVGPTAGYAWRGPLLITRLLVRGPCREKGGSREEECHLIAPPRLRDGLDVDQAHCSLRTRPHTRGPIQRLPDCGGFGACGEEQRARQVMLPRGSVWAPETTSSRAMGRLSHGRLAKSSPCRSRDKTCSELVQRDAKPCRAPGSRPAEVPPERLGRQVVLCDVAVRADANLAHPSHPILNDELREPSAPKLGMCEESAD